LENSQRVVRGLVETNVAVRGGDCLDHDIGARVRHRQDKRIINPWMQSKSTGDAVISASNAP